MKVQPSTKTALLPGLSWLYVHGQVFLIRGSNLPPIICEPPSNAGILIAAADALTAAPGPVAPTNKLPLTVWRLAGNHETIVTPVWAESANVELDTAMFRVDLHACTPCCPLFRATNPWIPNVALRKPL